MPIQIDWHQRFKQQAVWTQNIREHLASILSFEDVTSILEVGCGTGVITDWLQKIHCREIFGLDIIFENLSIARSYDNKTVFTCSDVYSIPFLDHSFDVSLFHYFLLWINDPINALNEIKRITKKGGLIVALAEPDYGGRIDYPDELNKIGDAQTQALIDAGADPLLGRKLGHLFNSAGLTDVHVGLLGGEWHNPPSIEERNMEWSVIMHDVHEQIGKVEIQKLRKIDNRSWESRERILFVPTFYAWGKND